MTYKQKYYILNLYDENVIDKDDVWLGWYGILPEFRSRGIGKQSLLDTIELAKRFNRKYFRLYTNNDINSTAYPLYEKVMSLREVYQNFEDDKEYVDKYAIYSCSFNDEEVLLWNNRCAYISEDCKMCDVSNEKLKDSYKILFDCDLKSKCFLDYERIATLFRSDGHLVYFVDDKNIKYDVRICSLELESVMKYDLVELNNFKEKVYKLLLRDHIEKAKDRNFFNFPLLTILINNIDHRVETESGRIVDAVYAFIRMLDFNNCLEEGGWGYMFNSHLAPASTYGVYYNKEGLTKLPEGTGANGYGYSMRFKFSPFLDVSTEGFLNNLKEFEKLLSQYIDYCFFQ